MTTLGKYACGHVGRQNEAPNAKAQAFIRVAEARKNKVEESAKNCPDCQKGGNQK